jgi:5-methyltetrahydrofolate--homocysteine methyltransferase
MMGTTPTEATGRLIETGADIVGANCGNGIQGMIGVVKEIRIVSKYIPILIHANAGIPVYQDGKSIFPETPEEMASYVPDLIEAGTNIVGGCCGTTPDHIRKIVANIRY